MPHPSAETAAQQEASSAEQGGEQAGGADTVSQQTQVVAATPNGSVPGTPIPSEAGEVEVQAGDQAVEAKGLKTCCTCRKVCNAEETLVVVKHSTKSPESRRCRSCHNSRAAINRLQRNHGNLVAEWQTVDEQTAQRFFANYGHLRGTELRLKLEETVSEWKTSVTRFEFDQEADFLDENAIREKYAAQPHVAENILANGRRFFCPVKQTMVFGDPKYKATVKDVEERGESKKRKGVVPLTVPEPQGLQDGPQSKSAKGPPAEDKKPEKVVKMKQGERKKMEKKVEALSTSRLTLLDLVSKAGKFQDMIPAYVLQSGTKTAADAVVAQEEAEKKLKEGNKPVEDVMNNLEEAQQQVDNALSRVRVQLEQAENFK